MNIKLYSVLFKTILSLNTVDDTKSNSTKYRIKVKHLAIGFFLTAIIIILTFRTEEKPQFETTKAQKQRVRQTIEFTSQIYPRNYVKINLGNQEDLEEVYVKMGDKVDKQEVLAQLNDSEQIENYNSAYSSYESAVEFSESIDEVEDELEDATENTEDEISERVNSLIKIIEEIPDLDEDFENQLITQTYSLSAASVILSETISDGLKELDLDELVKPQIDTAINQMDDASEAIENRKIKAPFSGEVVYLRSDSHINTSSTSMPTELDSLAGSYSISEDLSPLLASTSQSFPTSSKSTQASEVNLNPYTENAIVLADKTLYTIFAQATEEEIINISEGMKTELTFANDITIETQVDNIFLLPLSQGMENPNYYFEINVDEIPDRIPIGATVDGEVIIAQKDATLVAPIDSIVLSESENEVAYVYENGQKIEKQVKTGVQGEDYLEIISGIEEGDQIITKNLEPKKVVALRPWIKKILKHIQWAKKK